MAEAPDRDALRATLADFDDRQRKIVGGMIAVMIENPHRVREREWISEQFTHVTLLASGFEDVASVQAGMDQVQAYVRTNVTPLLNACFLLFLCVAEDMEGREDEATTEEAVIQALRYFPGGTQSTTPAGD